MIPTQLGNCRVRLTIPASLLSSAGGDRPGAGHDDMKKYSKQRGKYFWLILLVALLAACGDGDPAATGPAADVAEESAVDPVATATRTPRPLPTATSAPTMTPSPTPEPAPTLNVSDQELAEDGRLVVGSVTTLAPGWLVIQTDDNGLPGEILGYAPVATGVNDDIVVEVDPYMATPTMHVTLHRDDGRAGSFEYPGPDTPVQSNGAAVSLPFAVDIGVFLPELAVSDQEVTSEGEVRVDRVVSPGEGWVALHSDALGEPGGIIGQTYVAEGENENVLIRFDWREATPRMYVVLHHDAGESGLFDFPGADEPVAINSLPVTIPFNVTLPPDVFVINQPVLNSQIVVERAVVNEPAWLVVYNDVDGAASLIIGQHALEAGINSGIVIPIDDSAATPVLHLVLHNDDDELGEFNYPLTDRPLRHEGRQQLFSFRTDAGNYLITRDQPMATDGAVLVPLVVTDTPAWVVIETAVDGGPGAVVGRTWVPAGINRGVVVDVDPELFSEALYATLVLDAGVAQEFEYPGGADLPLQRNRTPIRAPFRILPSEV